MCLRYRLLYNLPFVTGNTAIELLELMGELEVKRGDISAEEEEEDTECAQLMERLAKEPREFKMEEPKVPETTGPGRPSNAADKKCIYNTFFKRRPGVDDDLVLRSMQAERIPQLNDKNFRKYLRDYKRRKLEQPVSRCLFVQIQWPSKHSKFLLALVFLSFKCF